METFLTVIHWFVAIALVVLVLIQAGSADMGTAFGGGGSSSLMGAGGGESFKRKLTAGFAVVFFITSFTLSYLVKNSTGSVIENDGAAKPAEVKKEEAPKAEVPAAAEEAAAKPAEGAAPAAAPESGAAAPEAPAAPAK